jgi:hypothetical protein
VARSRREIGEALQSMYLPLQAFLQEHGFDGRTCLLRSICEAAHSPFFHKESGLLDEIAHAILTYVSLTVYISDSHTVVHNVKGVYTIFVSVGRVIEER